VRIGFVSTADVTARPVGLLGRMVDVNSGKVLLMLWSWAINLSIQCCGADARPAVFGSPASRAAAAADLRAQPASTVVPCACNSLADCCALTEIAPCCARYQSRAPK